MENHTAYEALRSHRVEIDPGDKRSPAEIAAALGITTVKAAATVQLQNTPERTIHEVPTEGRL